MFFDLRIIQLTTSLDCIYSRFLCCCVVVITTVQIHSMKPELRFCAGSNPAQDVLEIRDGEDLWQWSWLEIRLNAFWRSIIKQRQFIIKNFLIIFFHQISLAKIKVNIFSQIYGLHNVLLLCCALITIVIIFIIFTILQYSWLMLIIIGDRVTLNQ